MYRGLNSYRALAFLGVYLFHQGTFSGGYLGVTAFFVLSGFLLTPILVDLKATSDTRSYFRIFYGRRALRIFPLYFFYLGLVALLSLGALALDTGADLVQLERFLAQLPWAGTFTFNFYHASVLYEHCYLITHFWSLAVEEQFYLVWPVLILLVPGRYLKAVLLLLLALGPVVRHYLGSEHFAAASTFFTPEVDVRVYVLPFSHIDAFATGGYFALFGTSRSALSVWVLAAAVLGLGVATEWLATDEIREKNFGYGPFMEDAFKHIWGYTVLNLFCAYVLVHIRERTFLPAFMEHPIPEYLGRISYGLYVYHFGIVWVLYHFLPETPTIVRVAAGLILTIGISAASYEWLEKPFMALKDRFFDRRRDEAVSSAPVTACADA